MKAEQQPNGPQEKIRLPFSVPNLSLPKNVNSLRAELKKSGNLYFENNSLIVSRKENKDQEGQEHVHFRVFDTQTGLPNFGAEYIKSEKKMQITEAIIYMYIKEPDSENLTLYITSSLKNNENSLLQTSYDLDTQTLRYHIKERRLPIKSIDTHVKEIKKQIYLISKGIDSSINEEQLD